MQNRQTIRRAGIILALTVLGVAGSAQASTIYDYTFMDT
jgi:hypothetical protein